MTELPSRPMPGTWRGTICDPTAKTTSKIRRRVTSRIMQYYGETRVTKLSSRPASLRHPRESAILVDTMLRDVSYSREELPRRSTTVWWCSQQQAATSVIPKDPYPHRKPGDLRRIYPDDHRSYTKTRSFSTTHLRRMSPDDHRPHTKTKSFSTTHTNTK